MITLNDHNWKLIRIPNSFPTEPFTRKKIIRNPIIQFSTVPASVIMGNLLARQCKKTYVKDWHWQILAKKQEYVLLDSPPV